MAGLWAMFPNSSSSVVCKKYSSMSEDWNLIRVKYMTRVELRRVEYARRFQYTRREEGNTVRNVTNNRRILLFKCIHYLTKTLVDDTKFERVCYDVLVEV